MLDNLVSRNSGSKPKGESVKFGDWKNVIKLPEQFSIGVLLSININEYAERALWLKHPLAKLVMENIKTTSSTTKTLEKKVIKPRLMLQALAFTGILYFSVGQTPQTPLNTTTRSLFQPIQASTRLLSSVSNAVLQHASQQSGLPTSDLRVVRVQPKTWTDDCLELGEPEILCTQRAVPGWHIAVASKQQSWLYRTNASGSAIKLERRTSLPSKKGKEVALTEP